MGLVGAAQRQDAAGIGLLEQGVPAVPALGGGNPPAHGGAVPDHGRDAQLGELPGVDGGRMDKEDTAGVLVDDVPDDVVDDLRLTHLGRGHKNDVANLRVGEGVHDGPEVRCPAGAPEARLGTGFGGKVPLALRPLGDGQVLWWLHPGQPPGDGLHQPAGRPVGFYFSPPPFASVIRHRSHSHALPASPSAPERARHISPGHRCRRTSPSSPGRPPA